jgi:hypothetical protein
MIPICIVIAAIMVVVIVIIVAAAVFGVVIVTDTTSDTMVTRRQVGNAVHDYMQHCCCHEWKSIIIVVDVSVAAAVLGVPLT